MNVSIQASHDKKVVVAVEPSDTAVEVKAKVGLLQGIPPAEIRLIFSGRILKDSDTVESLRIAEGNTIHMVRSPKAAAASGAAGSGAVPAPGAPQALGNSTGGAAVPSFTPVGGSQSQVAAPFGMGGGATTPTDQQMAALANNPEMLNQMMNLLEARPEMMESIIALSPELQNAPPHIKEMLRNPQMFRLMMQMSLAQTQMGASPAAMAGPMAGAPAAGANEEYMQTLAALMAGSPAGSVAPPPQSTEPPEVRFQDQLKQLTEMGFYDADTNIRALLATGGNVNLAIERLLQNM